MTNENNTHDAETSEGTAGSKAKAWVEENLRLIVSVIIVLAIAGGIYSYSQRGQEDNLALEDESTQEQILLEGEDEMIEEDEVIAEENEEENAMEDALEEESSEMEVNEEVSSTQTPEEVEVVSEEEEEKTQPTKEEAPQQPNKETTDGYIVTAQKGDGLTHMARRAVADYLAQNPDSTITVAHKIYIEDFVRKATHHSDGISVGQEITFSKNVIEQAVGLAKNLNETQLNNLQKYVVLVPSLN
jgi:hypothetical protein